jgi:RNA polymerase sigma factor (sigma-70 family)
MSLPPGVATGAKPRSSEEAESIALARRAAAGDLPATQDLLTQLTPTVARVVSGMMGSRNADFDDVVQQSLIALLRALPSFRGECHPAGFACRIAFRVALRIRKRRHMEHARLERLAELSATAASNSRPAQLEHPARRQRLLRELLDRLPEEQAEARVMRVILGFSLEEVARATGARVNTVRSRVRLAKEALRRRIEARPDLREELGVAR